ncbi:Alpha-glucosidase [Dactylellina cionopaga]|nr:Alpha-glucosidase [Dactylellina cionopaga]
MAAIAPATIAEEHVHTNGCNGVHTGKLSNGHKHAILPPDNRAWWKESSVYQIYPSSFKDSNGDGIGDIPGIISKIDYIHKLGANVVWLSPIYKSPMIDMGYDISDYVDIDPQYGTLEDVQKLADELHRRGMKLVMDLVVNHCSDEHEWFKQSKSSKDSPYRNWFHWHPGKVVNGKRVPPNNWSSYFGGSGWEWDEATQEYYLHIFAKEQPDLNWENPDVVTAVYDVIRFWLDRGVDGFRMDVINFISKEPGYPDAEITDPNALYQNGAEFFTHGPRLHEYLQEIGAILKKYNAFSVGEMPGVKDPEEILKVVGFEREELNMIFHFELVELDHGSEGKFSTKDFSLQRFKEITEKWQKFMYDNSGWNAIYLENHDQSRTISRWCSDSPEHRVPSAKMLAAYQGFQAGTPYIYQGQELGMINVPKDWDMSEYKDIECVNHWSEVSSRYSDNPEILARYRKEYQKKSRDNSRTPMQWSNSAHGGFMDSNESTEPWMRANPSYKFINAAQQVDDPESPFSFWKKVLELRREYVDLFVYGGFELVQGTLEDHNILAYRRMYGSQEAVVVCNWSLNKLERSKSALGISDMGDWTILASNNVKFEKGPSNVELMPWGLLVLYRSQRG